MPDARQITEQVRAALRSEMRAGEEDAALATSYALLTRQAHGRLSRCGDLLSNGLRSEAVQEAEVEPALLPLVAALELPEFEAWDARCRRHGLDRPSPLGDDVVQELNRAYAADQLVAPLLREYRFRCVTRQPRGLTRPGLRRRELR